MDIAGPATSPTARKRARTGDSIIPIEGGFVQDPEAGESGGDDDDDEDGKGKDKKAGRRKIKIEFINDKSRRHITFSKRKAGIMKKAYELSTLTGTQVLLLVVSETGLVYTFTTAKLQPLVTQPEGKNLIQSCLNAPAGQPPSSLPVGATIGRSAPQPTVNAPGGLAIDNDDGDDDSDGADREVKRPRRLSNEAGPGDAPAPPMPMPNQPQSHGASPGIPPRVSPTQSQPGPLQPGSSLPQQHAAPQPGVRPAQPVPYGAPPQPFHQDPSMGNSYMAPYSGYYNMPQQQQQQGMPQGQQYPRQ